MKPPLNILHTEASKGWGGQELRVLAELQGFAARGCRTRLLAPGDAQILQAARDRGIACEPFPFDRPLSFQGLRQIHRLCRRLRDDPADVIVTHSSHDSWQIGLARLFMRPAPAVVRTRHVSAPITDNFASRWLYRRSADRIAATGETIRRHILTVTGADPDNVEAVPTGVDSKRFDPDRYPDKTAVRRNLGLPENGRLIGIAATLRTWKGHQELLTAFERLQANHPDLHLIIAGDGPQRPRIETRKAAMQGGERTHILGHREDIPAILAALDIFALPSRSNEGVPQAILQAMAMGLPIVTTDAGSIAEAVQHEHNGLIVEKRNADNLEAGLSRVLEDRDLAARLGRNARADALAHHGVDAMLDRMERLMRTAIQDRAAVGS